MTNFIVSICPAGAGDYEFQDCFKAENSESALQQFMDKYPPLHFRIANNYDLRAMNCTTATNEYFRLTVFVGSKWMTAIEPLQEVAA